MARTAEVAGIAIALALMWKACKAFSTQAPAATASRGDIDGGSRENSRVPVEL